MRPQWRCRQRNDSTGNIAGRPIAAPSHTLACQQLHSWCWCLWSGWRWKPGGIDEVAALLGDLLQLRILCWLFNYCNVIADLVWDADRETVEVTTLLWDQVPLGASIWSVDSCTLNVMFCEDDRECRWRNVEVALCVLLLLWLALWFVERLHNQCWYLWFGWRWIWRYGWSGCDAGRPATGWNCIWSIDSCALDVSVCDCWWRSVDDGASRQDCCHSEPQWPVICNVGGCNVNGDTNGQMVNDGMSVGNLLLLSIMYQRKASNTTGHFVTMLITICYTAKKLSIMALPNWAHSHWSFDGCKKASQFDDCKTVADRRGWCYNVFQLWFCSIHQKWLSLYIQQHNGWANTVDVGSSFMDEPCE